MYFFYVVQQFKVVITVFHFTFWAFGVSLNNTILRHIAPFLRELIINGGRYRYALVTGASFYPTLVCSRFPDSQENENNCVGKAVFNLIMINMTI